MSLIINHFENCTVQFWRVCFQCTLPLCFCCVIVSNSRLTVSVFVLHNSPGSTPVLLCLTFTLNRHLYPLKFSVFHVFNTSFSVKNASNNFLFSGEGFSVSLFYWQISTYLWLRFFLSKSHVDQHSLLCHVLCFLFPYILLPLYFASWIARFCVNSEHITTIVCF